MIDVAGAEWTPDDVRNTLRAGGVWWGLLTEGRDASSVEHLGWEAADALAAALPAEPPARDGDPGAAMEAMGAPLVKRFAGTWDAADEEAAGAALGTLVDRLDRAAEGLRVAGQLPPSAQGHVVQLNVSGGGVPKLPVEAAVIGPRGLGGDRQRERRHHGRPWQAVCLWSADVIDAFAAEGHPIGYGCAGENVTVRGLDWSAVRPGVRLLVGDALLEVSVYALPCTHNARWFADGDFEHMHHERGPVSRVYAWVRRPGTVRTGDPVVLEPAR